jgi:hypothetical protein
MRVAVVLPPSGRVGVADSWVVAAYIAAGFEVDFVEASGSMQGARGDLVVEDEA